MSVQLENPLQLFAKWEASQPDKTYMTQPIDGTTISWTWKEAGDEIRRLAAALKAMDLPPESKIALVSKNCAYWIMADIAIMLAGHVSVPLYPNIGPETLTYILTHSEAPILFVGKLDDWPRMEPGLVEGVQCISFPKYGPVGEGYTPWESLTADQEPLQGLPDKKPTDTSTIIYTSGTTGTPKGVVHNYHSLTYAINNAFTEVEVGGNQARFFSYLPLSHIAERLLVELGCLVSGGEIFFAESLDTFPENLRSAAPTIFLGVPRIWTKFQMGVLQKMPPSKLNLFLKIPILSGIVKKKIKTALGLQMTRHCLTGAAPTPPAVMEFFKKIGITLQEVYGMTENSAYSHFNRVDNIRFGTVGQPMPHVQCKIGEEGEILVKSEANMVGYYKEPELSAAALKDGWLHTGDQGQIESDGFLRITGRVKDIFKTSKAKYVAPNPIELKLAKNKNVEQCCVVGNNIPQPIALIVLSEDAQKQPSSEVDGELAETLKAVNEVLEKHEKLKTAVVVKEAWTPENELLTPTLKIKRSLIDKKYESNYEKWYEDPAAVVRE